MVLPLSGYATLRVIDGVQLLRRGADDDAARALAIAWIRGGALPERA